MEVINAAKVLPEPVGAAINVWRPCAIAGQPSIWASVGSENLLLNHSLTRGWNRSRDMSKF